jgi:hypothetical protein
MSSPTENLCPKCGMEMEPYAEVDIGVGVMTGGPWGCPACHWVEPQEDVDSLFRPESLEDENPGF